MELYCMVCGKTMEAEEKPATCPKCGSDGESFVER